VAYCGDEVGKSLKFENPLINALIKSTQKWALVKTAKNFQICQMLISGNMRLIPPYLLNPRSSGDPLGI
jgi:hypothetical protein